MLAELWKSGVEKVVVVSNYTSTLDLIETHCKRQKYPYCRLDGRVSRRVRNAVIRFAADLDVPGFAAKRRSRTESRWLMASTAARDRATVSLTGYTAIVFASGSDVVVISRSRVSPLEQRWRDGLEQSVGRAGDLTQLK